MVSGSIPQAVSENVEVDTSSAVTLAEEQPSNALLNPAVLPRSHRVRRYLGWAIFGALVVLIGVPVGLWGHYQSMHVISRNAMVRGHLSEIGTRLDGVLAHLEVEEGQRVKAGQILARLEQSHIHADAQAAQAELDGLERELDVEHLTIAHEQRLLDNRLREAEANVAAAQAEVAAAASRATDAKRNHEVRAALLVSQAISSEDVRGAETDRRTAAALLKVAQANLTAANSARETANIESAGVSLRRERIGVLEANVARAKARLAGTHADLESALIRAPDDGAVVRWIIRPGGSVEVGSPVISMWVGDDIWVEAWVDEDEVSKVIVGSPATITLQSFPGTEFSGVVEQIGVTTDFEMPESEIPRPRFSRMRGAPVVGVLVRLDDPPQNLLPGLSALVAIRHPTN